MSVEVVMPKMGESIQEGKILKWHKKPGDTVARDEVLFEISTDKVDTEVPAAAAGVLGAILVPEGATVAVGTVVATLEPAGTTVAAAPRPSAPAPVPAPASPPPTPAARPSRAAAPASSGGAQTEIVMPKMGESIQEGKILKWLKKPGDPVARDEVLFEISTDKVDTEVPSPVAGVMGDILIAEGATVAVGTVVAHVATAAAAGSAPVAARATAPAPVAASPAAAPARTATGDGSERVPRTSGARFYSPVVRAIAEREHVAVAELDALQGTGLEGRVTKNDLLTYLKQRPARPSARPAAAPMPRVELPHGTPSTLAGEPVEIVPMDNVRQLIAEHMVRSKRTSPHVTAVHECDFTAIERYRASIKDGFKAREGVSLTPTPFIAWAVVHALREFPYVNASVDGTNIVVKKHINLGMATALSDGNLIVPVIREADNLGITGLARAIADLAGRARTKKLLPDEVQGGTFTITNYGVFGSLFGAPIINQPQVAILGTGAIVKRPVVRTMNGEDVIVVRSIGYLSLSHDHRLVDGMMGGQFMSRVVEILESFDPATAPM